MSLPAGGERSVDSLQKLDILKFARNLAIMFTVSWALTGILFTVSGDQYSSQKPNESVENSTITTLGYGFTEKELQDKLPSAPEGYSCFFKIEGIEKTFQYPSAACFELKEGQQVELFVRGDSVRLAPEYVTVAAGGTAFFAAAAFSLSLVNLIAFLVLRRKILRTWDFAIEKILSEGTGEGEKE